MAKKTKKTKTKVGIRKLEEKSMTKKKKAPLGRPPKRIRMLMSLANQDAAYIRGKAYDVPKEVPANTARSWIDSGAAEEDKSLPGPKETKIIGPEETK